MLHARARYRCARPTPSISSDSACNARPVHTVGSNPDFGTHNREVGFTPGNGHRQPVQSFPKGAIKFAKVAVYAGTRMAGASK